MRSSGHRRAAAGRTRLLAAGAVVTAVGGVIGFTQLSHAETGPSSQPSGAPSASPSGSRPPLEILTNSCEDSGLDAHDGFQRGNRCVSTAFGEVGAAANNPSLLIVRAPETVTRNTPFTITVSTRNLIRDRFLAAGQGGYYVESSVLRDGLTRGHFHSACRMLESTGQAPNPEPVPAFFVATEDRRGSATPDTVTIQVPGLPNAGTAQCASWAGDGSHRIPMMERANQTPAFDAVRITVVDGQQGGNNGGQQGGNNGGQQGGNTGGQTGGNNGGQQGGNTGGQTGGNNGGQQGVAPTAAPSTPPPATQSPATATPRTTVVRPAAPSPAATAPTTRATTTRATTGGAAQRPASTAPKPSEAAEQPRDTGDTGTKSATKPARPAPSRSAEADAEVVESADGPQAAGYADGAPDQPARDETVAEPPAPESTGPLAFVSENLALVSGGVVAALLALLAFAFTRRRRPGRAWQ